MTSSCIAAFHKGEDKTCLKLIGFVSLTCETKTYFITMPALDLVTMAWVLWIGWVETGSTFTDVVFFGNTKWDDLALWETLLDKELCELERTSVWWAGTDDDIILCWILDTY